MHAISGQVRSFPLRAYLLGPYMFKIQVHSVYWPQVCVERVLAVRRVSLYEGSIFLFLTGGQTIFKMLT